MQASIPPQFQQGLAAANAGDFARAEAIARDLLAADPDNVHAFQIIGFAAFRQGRNTEALQAFLRANRSAPEQPAVLYWLGVLFKERADYVQAERALQDAVRIDPQHAEAWCQLGEALFMLDRKEEASEAFESAIEIEPPSSIVLARAARYFEVTHDLARARSLAEQALQLDPANEIAAITLVEIDMREGRHDNVIARAPRILARVSGNLRNQARLRHLVATAHDRRGEYKQAFEEYEAANRLQSQLDGGNSSATPSPLHTDNIERIIRFLATTDISAWRDMEQAKELAPVFLLGFVRSGTTWLDQILSSHPSIAVMEEEDNFADAWRDLYVSHSGLAKLTVLSAPEIDSYRAAYWTRARQILKGGGAKPVIIDKLPLNTVQLPLIWRLFPEAKIIFALRDPRDAVFSAFQQHFQVNTGMSHFLDMKTAAKFYDRVMTIGYLTRRNAQIDVHEVRYENVVADLASEIRRLIAFLGLPWDDAVLDYQATAIKRAIRTPSARQVIEKPYATSIGKWRRYRDGMAPALPILAPWVERFGYQDS